MERVVTARRCSCCPASVTWDTVVVFELAAPVRLMGLDGDVVLTEVPAGPQMVCVDCAVPLLRRDVAGLVGRWVPAHGERGVTSASEVSALALRFVDALGPALDFADWWESRHPDA